MAVVGATVDGSTLRPMRVPEQPDAAALDLLLTRTAVVVELRATVENAPRAQELLAAIQAEVDAALDSRQKHREWRVRRYTVLSLLAELDQLLYYSLP
ncbi:MAG: hypothetical protein JO247_06020 [Chloroflexi bacterium]|nr:hypothetical protein [Chloroflexota bacterium]